MYVVGISVLCKDKIVNILSLLWPSAEDGRERAPSLSPVTVESAPEGVN